MQIETFAGFLLATAVVVAVPGPNIMLITHDSIRHGFKNSIITMTGINAGMILLFSLSLAGVSTLVMRFEWLFTGVKLAGAAYLIYLGLSQILAARAARAWQPVQTGGRFFIKGFLISATNPKGLFFAGAFFPQFLDPDTALAPQVILLCTGCLVVTSMISIAYAWFAGGAGKLFASDRFNRNSARVSGLVLAGFGIGLLFLGQSSFM